MEITSIRVDSYTPKEKGVCAEVTVELGGKVAIHKIRVINGDKGLFVAMPNTGSFFTTREGKKHIIDIAHPITKEFQEELDTKIIEVYKSKER
jgi:DNA-binding cell septation regulator SpoVG